MHASTVTHRSIAVSCRGVVKDFGTPSNRALALQGVDLDVHLGEMTFLVGPSGSGKSTLISVITRAGRRHGRRVRGGVRPLRAVHMTAGHNAFRGSGPGQKLALDSAMAQMGCPDHRIDRFCITCCQPFPTVPSRRGRRDLVSLPSLSVPMR